MTDYPADEAGRGTSISMSAAFDEEMKQTPVLPAFDAAKYRAHLESFELTAEQERVLLETLWSIMYGFVELGFNVDVGSVLLDATANLAAEDSGMAESLNSEFLKAVEVNTERRDPD